MVIISNERCGLRNSWRSRATVGGRRYAAGTSSPPSRAVTVSGGRRVYLAANSTKLPSSLPSSSSARSWCTAISWRRRPLRYPSSSSFLGSRIRPSREQFLAIRPLRGHRDRHHRLLIHRYATVYNYRYNYSYILPEHLTTLLNGRTGRTVWQSPFSNTSIFLLRRDNCPKYSPFGGRPIFLAVRLTFQKRINHIGTLTTLQQNTNKTNLSRPRVEKVPTKIRTYGMRTCIGF